MGTPLLGLTDTTGGSYSTISQVDAYNIQENKFLIIALVVVGGWILAELLTKRGV